VTFGGLVLAIEHKLNPPRPGLGFKAPVAARAEIDRYAVVRQHITKTGMLSVGEDIDEVVYLIRSNNDSQ
jgi:hypothetical protein